MRKLIAGIFLGLLMLQTIPILHFFSGKGEVFYTSIDEEKPGENAKEKMEGKEYISLETEAIAYLLINMGYNTTIDNNYASPSLALLTPPPDAPFNA